MKKIVFILLLLSMVSVSAFGQTGVGPSAILIVKDPWVDVRAFGAACDGVTNDTQAWIDAMAALPGSQEGSPTGTIFFDGTCAVIDLEIANHGIRIKGFSKYSSKFILHPDSVDSVFVLSTNGKSGLVLEDFRIDGNHTNNTTQAGVSFGRGLSIVNSYYCRFINIDVRETMGPGYAMTSFPGSGANVFMGCLAYKCEGVGWYMSSGWNNGFYNCGSEANQTIGFWDTNLTINNFYSNCYVEQTSIRDEDNPRAFFLNGDRTVVLCPTISSSGISPSVGLEIGSSASNITITSPRFSGNATDILFASGASASHTTFIGIVPEDLTIVNTGNDITSVFINGNQIGGVGSHAIWYSDGSSPNSNVNVAIDRTAGNFGNFWFRTAGVNRWRIGVDDTAESGNNAGSDFDIRRRSDAGVDLGSALFIKRSSGETTIPNLQYDNIVCIDNAVVCLDNEVITY